MASGTPRRGVFQWVRRAFFATATASSIVLPRGRAATAADAQALESADGPVVEFKLENLDGDEGESGVVKIQLHPEWAPKGVDRFEVSFTRPATLSSVNHWGMKC